ncbi:hypothetical protein ACUOFZ_24415, partial [Escherichia coli]
MSRAELLRDIEAIISGAGFELSNSEAPITFKKNVSYPGLIAGKGTVAKLAMRQPFVLFKGLTFQKLCLPGAFRPGDHHNKMLRP